MSQLLKSLKKNKEDKDKDTWKIKEKGGKEKKKREEERKKFRKEDISRKSTKQ